MRRIRLRLYAIVIAAGFSTHANADDSADALIVLTTVGYLVGAADACKVVPKQSNQLAVGMAIAIGHGNYGKLAEAHALLNNARQRGIADVAARKVDCVKIGDLVLKYVRSLLKK